MKPTLISAAIMGNTTKRTIGAAGAGPAAETATGAPLARRAASSSPVGMLPVVKLYPCGAASFSGSPQPPAEIAHAARREYRQRGRVE